MVITMSNWGSDYETMKWLDGETGCKGNCDNNPNITISNIKISNSNHLK